MEPLVSVLIPAYNAEQWIAETIQSALAQTWKNKQIIIVDDGSKDETLKIAQGFESPSVIVTSQVNQGAAAARNKAFSISKGEFIQWLDADDLLHPAKIALQIEALRGFANRQSLLSCGWGRFLYRPRKANFRPTSLWHDLTPTEWILRKMEDDVCMQTATWLVSRELTVAAGPWDTRLVGDDDGEYFCRVLLASDGTKFVPEAKTYWRLTGAGSLSWWMGHSIKKLEAQLLSCQLHVEYLRSVSDSPRARDACVKFLQKYMPCYYPEHPDMVQVLQKMAVLCGGRLEVPTLGRKYRWLQRMVGLRAAKRIQITYNRYKWALCQKADHFVRWMEEGMLKSKDVRF